MTNVIQLRPKQVEFGVFYHAFLERMATKYGLDYSKRYLVDLDKFTDTELREFTRLYTDMMLARGVSPTKILNSLKDAIGESVLATKY